jgi:hypothetical protein
MNFLTSGGKRQLSAKVEIGYTLTKRLDMAKNGTYFLGRVLKFHSLDTAGLIKALLGPIPVVRRGNAWTIIDGQQLWDGRSQYLYGRLIKYDPDARVTVVDPAGRTEVEQEEPNLSLAASPFVYIPDHSGIAFLNVWNHIEPHTFMRRWCEVVEASYGNFFVGCEIQAISDLRSFASRLASLDRIAEISATVSPPNPLFGSLWAELKQYVEARKAEKLKHEESRDDGGALNTDLASSVITLLNQGEDGVQVPGSLPMGDAVILMAADGYGRGYVRGEQGGETVVVRTTESIKTFRAEKNPSPEELYQRALSEFEMVRTERQMEH